MEIPENITQTTNTTYTSALNSTFLNGSAGEVNVTSNVIYSTTLEMLNKTISSNLNDVTTTFTFEKTEVNTTALPEIHGTIFATVTPTANNKVLMDKLLKITSFSGNGYLEPAHIPVWPSWALFSVMLFVGALIFVACAAQKSCRRARRSRSYSALDTRDPFKAHRYEKVYKTEESRGMDGDYENTYVGVSTPLLQSNTVI